jgi:hypothetical protein
MADENELVAGAEEVTSDVENTVEDGIKEVAQTVIETVKAEAAKVEVKMITLINTSAQKAELYIGDKFRVVKGYEEFSIPEVLKHFALVHPAIIEK